MGEDSIQHIHAVISMYEKDVAQLIEDILAKQNELENVENVYIKYKFTTELNNYRLQLEQMQQSLVEHQNKLASREKQIRLASQENPKQPPGGGRRKHRTKRRRHSRRRRTTKK